LDNIRASDEKVLQKANRRMYRFEKESRMLEKRSEEYKVMEEVFDKPTLMTLLDLMNNHAFRYLNGVVNAGKESRVYWGVQHDGSTVAVKIYLTVSAEFKKRLIYIQGDPRFSRARKGSANLVELWAQKEYRNLSTAYSAGVRVPRPHHVKRNVLVMDFVGQDGDPAPLLSEVEVTQFDYARVLKMIERLYKKARLVHADLSEFNIFKDHRRLVMFDFASAVDISHPSSKFFLTRDIININRFFARRGVGVASLDDILRRVTVP
jgi:RIO kinase 1